MKQVITLLVATVISLTSFAKVTPAKAKHNPPVKSVVTKASTLQLSLQSGGKINLNWAAGLETSTSFYKIEKSVNGGAFKAVAILMGESNANYSYRDNIKEVKGRVTYRVVMMDDEKVVCTLNQSLVVL
jgi:hypothetical protein